MKIQPVLEKNQQLQTQLDITCPKMGSFWLPYAVMKSRQQERGTQASRWTDFRIVVLEQERATGLK
jgi:hypothetical protein